MSTVGALNHASHPAQTVELGYMTAVISKMWLFTVVELYQVCDNTWLCYRADEKGPSNMIP